MRVGLIGAGNIANYAHLPAYSQTPGVEIAAICDIVVEKAEQAAQEYSIPQVFADYHEMLKLKLDAVSICVPNFVHAETAIASLEAGCHVLCEKPMALSAAEGERMAATAKRAGKIFMMAFNNRFRSDTRALKRIIDSGSLGEIYFARAGWTRRRGIPGWGTWFTTKEMSGGGALIDIGVHVLDLSMWLMGKPAPITVMGSTYAKFGTVFGRGSGGWGKEDPSGKFNVDDLACAMIRFANGASLFLEASWAAHIETEQVFVTLLGEKAGATISGVPPKTRLYTEVAGVAQDTLLTMPDPAPLAAYAAEVKEFVACINEGRQPESSAADGVRVMRVLDAIYASAQSGSAITVP